MKNITAMNVFIYPLNTIMPTFWQSYLFFHGANWQHPPLALPLSQLHIKKNVLLLISVLPEAGLVVPPLHSYLCHLSCLTSGPLSTAQCTFIAWGESIGGSCCTFWTAWLGRGVRGDFNLSQPLVKTLVNTQADSFSGYQCLGLRWQLTGWVSWN